MEGGEEGVVVEVGVVLGSTQGVGYAGGLDVVDRRFQGDAVFADGVVFRDEVFAPGVAVRTGIFADGVDDREFGDNGFEVVAAPLSGEVVVVEGVVESVVCAKCGDRGVARGVARRLVFSSGAAELALGVVEGVVEGVVPCGPVFAAGGVLGCGDRVVVVAEGVVEIVHGGGVFAKRGGDVVEGVVEVVPGRTEFTAGAGVVFHGVVCAAPPGLGDVEGVRCTAETIAEKTVIVFAACGLVCLLGVVEFTSRAASYSPRALLKAWSMAATHSSPSPAEAGAWGSVRQARKVAIAAALHMARSSSAGITRRRPPEAGPAGGCNRMVAALREPWPALIAVARQDHVPTGRVRRGGPVRRVVDKKRHALPRATTKDPTVRYSNIARIRRNLLCDKLVRNINIPGWKETGGVVTCRPLTACCVAKRYRSAPG